MKTKVTGAAIAAVVVLAGAARAGEQKFEGAQFRLDRPSRFERNGRPVQKARRPLPPLKVRVSIPRGKPVPPGLRNYVVPVRSMEMANVPQQFDLRDPTRAAIESALESPDVTRVELARPLQIPPSVDLVPFNRDARLSHFVHLFEANIHNGGGGTVTAAVIDGGCIRRTHVEFQTNRVTLGEPATPEDAHATHVAGTMAAKGVHTEARGMAPGLKLLSYSFLGNDLDKLESAAPQIQVSNHSYGPYAGWARVNSEGMWFWLWFGDVSVSGQEDLGFGRYSSDCQALDAILTEHVHLLSVVAAGNDRDDGPLNQPILHYVTEIDPATGEPNWVQSSAVRNKDGFKSNGLDTLSGLSVSKNALCVGAINDTFQRGSPIPGAQLETTFFSSWGPTDDGRVKPDVVANGQTLFSPTIPPPGSATPD